MSPNDKLHTRAPNAEVAAPDNPRCRHEPVAGCRGAAPTTAIHSADDTATAVVRPVRRLTTAPPPPPPPPPLGVPLPSPPSTTSGVPLLAAGGAASAPHSAMRRTVKRRKGVRGPSGCRVTTTSALPPSSTSTATSTPGAVQACCGWCRRRRWRRDGSSSGSAGCDDRQRWRHASRPRWRARTSHARRRRRQASG